MEKQSFIVKLDSGDGRFWLQEEGDTHPFESEADFGMFDSLANGAMWTISTKETTRSRKWKASSGMTKSILAHIDTVRDFLNYNYLVMVQTPDVEIVFFKD